MPFAYGQRTGVTSFVRLVQALCELITIYSSTLIQWVNNSTMAPADKTTIINFINNMQTICTIVKPISTY